MREVSEYRRNKDKISKVVINICVGFTFVIGICGLGYGFTNSFVNFCSYNKAMKLLYEGEYDKVIEIFEDIREFEDSDKMIIEANHRKAAMLFKRGEHGEAIDVLKNIRNDTSRVGELVKKERYIDAFALLGIDVDGEINRQVNEQINQHQNKQTGDTKSYYK